MGSTSDEGRDEAGLGRGGSWAVVQSEWKTQPTCWGLLKLGVPLGLSQVRDERQSLDVGTVTLGETALSS